MNLDLSKYFDESLPTDPFVPCCWKNHCHGVLREVIGFIENKLRKYPNEYQFVWASLPAIVNGCSRFPKDEEEKKKRSHYSSRVIKEALYVLREKNIISHLHFETIRGKRYLGFVLNPHDSLCLEGDHQCEFKGFGNVPDVTWQLRRVKVRRTNRWATLVIWRGDSDAEVAFDPSNPTVTFRMYPETVSRSSRKDFEPQLNHGSEPFGSQSVHSRFTVEEPFGSQSGSQSVHSREENSGGNDNE
jgi:hypothetical protein